MTSRQKTNRSYKKAPCIACYSPEGISKEHDEFDGPLDKSHVKSPKHQFITTVEMDEIDLSILKPQKDKLGSDKYYFQREEHNRRRKLNDKKPWLDLKYCKKNRDYILYCNYCEDFTLKNHEQLDSHWKNYQIHFMNDLNNLLSKYDTKIDKFALEFAKKYAGIKLEDTKELSGNRTGLSASSSRNMTNELEDDSGIEVSKNKSFARDQLITSTPIKNKKKFSPKTNVEKETKYVKDLHTSKEIRKIAQKDTIRMYYQNVNSIKSDEKMKNFTVSSVRNYDIIIFTETWLEDGQPLKHNMGVFNEHYDVYRCNRSKSIKSRGGGALIAVSAIFYSDRVLLNEFDNLEYVCVQFLNNNKSIFVYCAYIPPDSTIDIYKQHFNTIDSINLDKNDILLVVGDFNLPNFIWTTKDDVTFIPEINDSIRETRLQTKKLALLRELLSKCKLYQFCNAKNPKGNVLDLVFSNDIDHISIAKLPELQSPMSSADTRHAPPFEILLNMKTLDC